jgi:predicted nucleotidyltransferase
MRNLEGKIVPQGGFGWSGHALDTPEPPGYVPGMPVQRPAQLRIPLPLEEIESLCRKWRIRELSLFGSVLRDDFHPGSDVDVLVAFEPEAHWSLFDFVDLQDEMEGLFHRKVDVVSERGLRNPFRRREILGTRQVVYAA